MWQKWQANVWIWRENSKTKILMTNGHLPDGTPQSFYFESGPQIGLFKGMTIILQEWGLDRESKLWAECPKFHCATNSEFAVSCYQCCVLYNQPDFREVKSHLEIVCKARGYEVIFLPMFHCELNFIEQCWGYAKRIYRHYPPSPKEADLEANVLAALESIPLESMHRFVTILNTWHFTYFSVTLDLQWDLLDLQMLIREVWLVNKLLELLKIPGTLYTTRGAYGSPWQG